MSRQEAFRLEVVVVANVLGAEWTDLVYSDWLFQAVPREELAKEASGVIGRSISQDARLFTEGDEL